MSDSKSRDHGRGRERSSDSNRGNNRSGGRKFEKRGGVSGRREERRGNRRDERRNDRKGHDRDKHKVSHPQRSGYREERINRRMTDPDLPSDIDITDLDPSVLQDLSSLSKENSEAVAKHLIMAATWLDDDPQLSLRHARAAKDRAGRVSVAREMNGIAAYRAGEWKEALAELRAARRISGGPGLLAVMADCERGMGRPEKAVELWRSDDAKELAPEDAIELAIVAAGARLDMGQADSAVVTIQRAQPNKNDTGVAACRLSYAYANALLEAGRKDEAKEWFQHATDIDEGDWTDAAERLAEC
ncbi:tetratricopeptide repeat protein [Corynebacterium sp. MSK218]|uniref:tetratricopeptide repeat protein n=1 Tax=Corynebacterium sp. MSK218 TaxID=3050218 RepID=UPI00254A2646|nr:tetratricopeptide repeat protein [Corynebacterium sp. MSK218]MDK8763009.1 tetratricopeptide repeat protein [Corynebacterium sp. MSK218]